MRKPGLSRRDWMAATPLGLLGRQGARGTARPNVVLIITDDQGYGDLGCHGNPVVKTPNLDRLHAESIRLVNFHVSPTCAPTRSALMTGRYTNATGCWHTIMGRSLLPPDEVTLADCFRASGYRTAIFGKWHLGDNYPSRPQDHGFEEVLVHGGGGVWQTPDYFGNDYFDDTYFHNGKPEKQEGFCTDVWFSNAMKFMAAAGREGRPFFCYLTTNAPHGPMWAPERYAAMYRDVKGADLQGFLGMITNIDDNVGRLRRFLRQEGLEENTVLIFTTDNGTSSGDGIFNAGMRGKKGSAYEGGHRVPFFIHWPQGGLKGPRDIETLAAHIDVLPTLVELCELKQPPGPGIHGRSLRPLLYHRTAEWPERTIVVDSQRLEHLVRWRQTAVMTQRWRLVNPSPDGDPAKLELYDMRSDPGQKQNVAADHPEVMGNLRREYDGWWKTVSQRATEYARIRLGNRAENPARLTAHDWHGEGANAIWNQRMIRRAPAVNGFWAVHVEKAGRYRIELRRWPREMDLPVNAAFTDASYNREKTAGTAIGAVKARMQIGSVDETVEVKPEDKGAVFTVDLKEGPAELRTWFYSADGSERGAYYVYVER